MSVQRFSKDLIGVTYRNCYRKFSKPVNRRSYCSSQSTSKTDILNIPLSKAVNSIPSPKYAVPNRNSETKITTLENGLRVATENNFGHFCTVGVVIDSGSRYEVLYPSGISHFLEKLAYGATTKYEDRDSILHSLENVGGVCDCQGSRDTLIYAMSASIEGLPQITDILSEVTLRPHILDKELEDARQAISFELEALDMNPDPEPLLMEMIHKAAFNNNTLGLPKFCSKDNIPLITKDKLYTYMKNYHTPDRMVLAGVGIQHEKLVELAQKHFVEKTPIWEENGTLIDTSLGRDYSIAQYTGGSDLVEKDLSNVSLGPTPIPEMVHVVIGLESSSHKDPDFISFCVLNMLMGGGGSFSAGGPGKGMYSRLYVNVLNRYNWMYSATANNLAYNDSGMFCIHASADPSSIRELTGVVIKEFVNIQNGVNEVELRRAKTMLQGMLLMNLESRPVMFEDVGRQVLANNKRLNAKYYFDEIAKIQEEDIVRVAKRMLKTPPAVAALGSIAKLPTQKDIWTALHSRSGKLPLKILQTSIL